jgi:hypothetical protein
MFCQQSSPVIGGEFIRSFSGGSDCARLSFNCNVESDLASAYAVRAKMIHMNHFVAPVLMPLMNCEPVGSELSLVRCQSDVNTQ